MTVGLIGAVALALSLVLLALTSWRALVLVEPVRNHLRHLNELHEASRQTQNLLVRHIANQPPPTEAEVEAIRTRLARIVARDGNLDARTPEDLSQATAALAAFSSDPRAALVASLVEIRSSIDREYAAHTRLIEEMHAYSLREFRIALATCVGLPAVAALLFLMLRGRILYSFDQLSSLLERLGTQEFKPAPIDPADHDMRPVVESYNQLVERLAVAETENRRRRSELEAQVQAATRTVLQQGRELAEADRLASVGETSARIAHELRNPLAGLELALRNLRVDCECTGSCPDAELFQRLDPMIAEIGRMTRLLNELLERGRRSPEAASPIDLGTCIRETATLARYQTPDRVAIEVEAPDHLGCLLPRDTLRQVVFNLVLNAVQAIADKPGRVTVGVTHGADEVTLAIADSGPGFPEEILALGPRMFLTRRPGGTGLGLATVQRLTQSMGGRMQLANGAAGGAVVTLTLPCRSANA